MKQTGYVLIDLAGVDVSSTGQLAISGISEKLADCYKLGKNVVIAGTVDGSSQVTPTAGALTYDPTTETFTIHAALSDAVNKITVTDDVVTLESTGSGGGGGGNDPHIIVGLANVDITAEGHVQDLSGTNLYSTLTEGILNASNVFAVTGLFGDSSYTKRISTTPASVMIDGDDVCLYVCASDSITKIIIDSNDQVYVGTKETT